MKTSTRQLLSFIAILPLVAISAHDAWAQNYIYDSNTGQYLPAPVQQLPAPVQQLPAPVQQLPAPVSPRRSNNSPRRSNNSPRRSNNSPRRSNNSPRRSNNSLHRSNNSPHRSNNSPRRSKKNHPPYNSPLKHLLQNNSSSLETPKTASSPVTSSMTISRTAHQARHMTSRIILPIFPSSQENPN